MKTRYMILLQNGSVSQHEVELPDDATKRNKQVDAICKKVIDGHLEHVNVFWEGEYCHMFVDEEGLLKSNPRFNILGTVIYWNNMLTHRPEQTHNLRSHLIVGDAVVFLDKGVVT